MLKLFKYENYKLTISEEAYLLQPFKKVFDNDKTLSKGNALMELDYIYFMCDPRSDYMQYLDKNERHIEVCKGLGLGNKWKPSKQVKDAMEFYESFNPTSVKLLNDMRSSIEKLRGTINNIDTNEMENPISAVKDMASALKTLLPLIGEIDKLEKQVNEEALNNDRIRGQVEKTIFEDPTF